MPERKRAIGNGSCRGTKTFYEPRANPNEGSRESF